MLPDPTSADTEYVQERMELRHHVARCLERQTRPIVHDAIAVLPFTGVAAGEADSDHRLAELAVRLLAAAAREGTLDARHELMADLREVAEGKGITIAQVFGLVYLVERAALDELALDESFGATSEPWPALAQLVRRASFDVLSAYADRLTREPGGDALTDVLTTLHTRAVLVAAADKEVHRAERSGHPFALILIDVDRLSEINARHGYGSGDRVLERLGILMRQYFREQDWVCRYSGDVFAVLLPDTHPEHAVLLAERVRATVEGRIALHDYRSQEEVPVTVSVAVAVVEAVDRRTRVERLFEGAVHALERAKQAGRNRVEKVDLSIVRSTADPRE